MPDAVEFETPENITVRYELAGPGTRFVAWVFDVLILFIVYLFLFFLFMFSGLAFGMPGDMGSPVAAFIVAAAFGLSFLLYFLLFELFMHGQTLGKRTERIRVVSAAGFSLTFGALFMRNIFRVLDTVPLLWIVPLVSERTQRLGDMVAGTVVVQERAFNADSAQGRLLRRSAREARFTFSAAQLDQLQENDVKTVEMYLDRRAAMTPAQADELRSKLIAVMTERMGVPLEEYGGDAEQQYLEDMIAAHLRNQVRELE